MCGALPPLCTRFAGNGKPGGRDIVGHEPVRSEQRRVGGNRSPVTVRARTGWRQARPGFPSLRFAGENFAARHDVDGIALQHLANLRFQRRSLLDHQHEDAGRLAAPAFADADHAGQRQ